MADDTHTAGRGGEDPRVIGIDASRANAAARTGTEWYAYHLIQELKDVIPDDVRIVLYSREPLRDGLEELPAHWRSAVLRWPWRFWTQLRLSFEIFTRPPDLLFVPAHALPAVLPERSVTTVHDVAFMTVPDAYGRFERWYHQQATKHAVRSADRIITVSAFSREEIARHFGADEAAIAVTHLGYDSERFRPMEGPAVDRTLRELGVDRPYFLFVGRIETKKNIEGMLAAHRAFVDRGGEAGLVLVGKRGKGGMEAMAGVRRDDRVFELGYVPPDDLPALYAGASGLLFVSRYEGFGIPVLEAFACRTPVIASATTSLPEVCGDAALYVAPDDIDGIAQAMRRLAEEPALAERLRGLGSERVERFAWRKTAEATWAVLRDTLEHGM